MGGLQNGQISNLLSALESKQAKIDALMLEFCPGEMPAAQAENWAKHQRPVDENTRDAINSADSGHPHIAKLRAEAETLRRDAERWQYFASCPQTALMLGSELDPNSDQDWEAECRMLADAAITEQALQALADEAQSMGLYDPHCPRCGGTMLPGVAIQNTAVGIQDMGEVCTMSYGGPGKMIECLKCEKCGYSVT